MRNGYKKQSIIIIEFFNWNDNKAQWKIINELSGNKKHVTYRIEIKVHDSLITDQMLVASEFNNFSLMFPLSCHLLCLIFHKMTTVM